ncbi:MAG: iron ABC transporter permease, partial [Gemmatimonadota bacterium]
VIIDVLKELPLTLILRPFNFDTLATRAFQLASDEQLAESAPAALVVIACASVVAAVLQRAIDRRAAA